MEINIDTDAIQEALVRAIADSTIGEQIKEVIEKEFTEKRNSWDKETILQSAIKQEVTRLISITLREEIESRKEEVRALVAPQLTDEIIRRMGASAVEVMLGNLERV